METFRRQGRTFIAWLQQLNQFDYVNSIREDQQRLATRIYMFLLSSQLSK